MCGIFWHMYKCKEAVKHNQYDSVIDNVKRRGPDGCCTKNVDLTSQWKADIVGSVKWTQGHQVQLQPIIWNDNILLWNGDVFKGQLKGDENDSDSKKIMEWLEANDRDVTKLVLLIRGPYSIVYWNNEEEILWFGRDPLGRHSLLWSFSDDEFLITSVGHKSLTLTEVPAVGIFSVSLDNKLSEGVVLHTWSHCDSEFVLSHQNMENIKLSKNQISALNFPKLNHEGPSEDEIKMFDQYFLNHKDYHKFYEMLLNNSEIEDRVKKFYHILCNSISIRVKTHPKIYTDNKIAILFSGGLDSTVIALIADKFVNDEESIDLLNVAFETENLGFNAPDRITALSSLDELSVLCPKRKWNLIQINISQEELAEKRKNKICHLIHPLNTILDESIGCALWFACNSGNKSSKARMIYLIGIGADEQLGGYMRHRTLLRRQGWNELSNQLYKETRDISRRNMGRDNRAVADHGIVPRLPFLDEDVVEFLNGLPPWNRCWPTNELQTGIGDKLLLRLLAFSLGLRNSSTLPKRALQFGSRIAKRKEDAKSISVRL